MSVYKLEDTEESEVVPTIGIALVDGKLTPITSPSDTKKDSVSFRAYSTQNILALVRTYCIDNVLRLLLDREYKLVLLSRDQTPTVMESVDPDVTDLV